MLKNTFMLTTSVALALSLAAPVAAQVVDEVIVTATKRQQTLQEVPIAVTVTSADTIEKAKILDILDLQSVVPSLRVNQLQNSTQTNFIIRGFGNGANNAGIEPSVGVFIDGVYRSRSASQIGDLPKLDRVEVLRGPQSTLFGKNASAGVISVVTAKPSFTSTGYVEGGISNYDGRLVKAYFSGPLSDDLAVSIGGSLNKRDGYATNIITGNDLNNRDRFSMRGQALYQPSDTVELRVIADYDTVEETCCFAPNAVNGPTGAAVAAVGGQIITDPFSYETAMTFDPTNKQENYGVSFHADVNLGNVDLTSISSYRKSDSANNNDVDFNSADIIGGNPRSLELDTFTQEIRLASNFDGPLNGIVGAYAFSEELSQTDGIFFGSDFRGYASGLAAGAGIPIPNLFSTLELFSGVADGTFFRDGAGVAETSTQSNTTFNLFGQFDYEVSDRLTATVGLAYVNDSKDVTVNQLNTDVYSNTDLRGPLLALGYASQVAPTPIGGICGLAPSAAALGCFATNFPAQLAGLQAAFVNPLNAGLSGFQFLPQLIGIPNSVEDGSSKDTNVDYTLRLAYDASDNFNVYGSYSTGYKSSSWNLSRDSKPNVVDAAALFPAGLPFNLVTSQRLAEPEEASVFELGLKAKFDQGSLNVAVFDQTIKNFQSNAFIGTAFTLANAEKQSVRGVEAEGLWYPVDGLTLGLAGTYLDPNYDSFTASAFGDISGTRPGGVPEIALSTSAGYDFDMGGNDAYVRADYQYESEVDIQDGGDLNPANITLATADVRTRTISTFNASAGVSLGSLDMSIWARNLLNDEALITNFPTVTQAGSFNVYPVAPRTYGISARYHFD